MPKQTAEIDIQLSNGQQAGKTINELTAQSAKLAREIKKMEIGSSEYVQATEDYQKVASRLKEVKTEVFSTQKAQGLLNSEMGQFIPFNKQLSGMVGTFQGLGGAIKGATISQRALNIAIAASGIGLLVIVLAKLIQAFLDTQAGMDKVTAVTRPLFAIFDRLKGLVQELGGSVFKGLGQILKGDIAEGLKTLGSGITDAVTGVGGAIKEGAKAGSELDKLQKQIEKTQNDMILSQARLNRQIAEQSEKARDAALSEKERKAAAEEAIKLIKQRTDEEDKLLQMQIKKLEIEQSLNDTDRQGEAEMNQLIAQREELLARAAQERVRLNSIAHKSAKTGEKDVTTNLEKEAEKRKKILEKEQEEREKQIQKTLEAEIKAREDQKKLGEDALAGYKAQQQAQFEARMNNLVTMNEAEQRMIDELFFTNMVTQEERDQMLYDSQKKALEDRLALLMANGQQTSEAYQSLYMQMLQLQYEHERKQTEVTEQEEEKRKALRDASLASAAGVFAGLASLLSQNTKQRKKNLAAIKAAQIAEVTMNTATELSGIFKSTSGWGPLGWILAISQAAIAVGRGLGAINRINNVKIDEGGQAFADGGVVFGKSHREGGIPFFAGGKQHEMEGGEIILTKGVYQDPVLRSLASELNARGGGRRFEMGGPVTNRFMSANTPSEISPSGPNNSSLIDMRRTEAYLAEIAVNTRVTAEKPVLSTGRIREELNTLIETEQDARF